ncbi:MAG: DUF3280 domain-containing protein [Azoarcus sp.]|nr:DUF3280 domain-containing protein [Azoarcus sp.]
MMARGMGLRSVCGCIVGLLITCASILPAWAEPPTLVVLDFDLLEDHPDPAQAADLQRRLARVRDMFADGVAAAGVYRVIGLGAAQPVHDGYRRQIQNVHRCGYCQVEIGKAAGARLTAAGWVQKVSNLILNINVEIRDVEADRVVLTKSVDIRSNTDQSWERGMRFLVRDIVERRAANPDYGQ